MRSAQSLIEGVRLRRPQPHRGDREVDRGRGDRIAVVHQKPTHPAVDAPPWRREQRGGIPWACLRLPVAVPSRLNRQRAWMWTVSADGRTLMTMPKGALVRAVMLNHVYHHRGQLSVYLRLLDVPVPSIYGPSADENPFM